MGTTHRVASPVRRLEETIATLVSARDSVILAYSGGLASTLIAMIARKRCDLRCVVAGVESSPDVEAAKLAKCYLDYRVEYVYLAEPEARSFGERIAKEAESLCVRTDGADPRPGRPRADGRASDSRRIRRTANPSGARLRA